MFLIIISHLKMAMLIFIFAYCISITFVDNFNHLEEVSLFCTTKGSVT